MNLVGKTIAVLGSVGREDPGLRRMRARLTQEGARLMLIGYPDGDLEIPDLLLKAAHEIWFDALIIPDGPHAERLASDEAARELVTQFEIDAKPIAAIGRGLLVLAAAELVAGRHVATIPAIREQVAAQGGRPSEASLVEDEMWLTARSGDALEDLLDRLVASVRRVHLAARDASSPLDD